MKELKTRNGFTLIELLTVIAIIAILAALIFPAIKKSLEKAEVANAQTDIKNIETALKSYYTEYGKWPNGNGNTKDYSYGAFGSTYPASCNQYCENLWLMQTLQGVSTNTDTCDCGNLNDTANPKKIVFLEISKKSLSPNGNFLDPWKTPYQITVDVDYDNTCTNLANTINNSAPTPGGINYVANRTAVVWSLGPDGKGNTKDDVTSW